MKEVKKSNKKVLIIVISILVVLIIGVTCFLIFRKSDDSVSIPVQSVKLLVNNLSGASNRFNGVVVNDSSTGINKDDTRDIKKIYVSVNDKVKKGDKLFSYDVDDIKTKIKEENLALKRMQNSITTNNKEIKLLKSEREDTSEEVYEDLTLQIKELENDNKQTKYNINVKKLEIEKLRNSLKEVFVTSPVSGTIQSINNGNNENNDNNNYFITIVKNGKYKVKGTINETNIRSINVNDKVKLISRIDSKDIWYGTIKKIDTTTKDNNSNNRYYYSGMDSDSRSTNYPFYISLDDTSDLMLGQHLYIEKTESDREEGLWLSSYFVVNEEDKYYVWISDNKDKLVKKEISISKYDEMMDEYLIINGLNLDDYVASPSDKLNNGMKVKKYDNEEEFYEDINNNEIYKEEESTNNEIDYSDENFEVFDGDIAYE